MAISVNDSSARGPLYTGLVPARILAISPTLHELKTVLGRPAEKDPVYLSNVDSKRTPGTQVRQVRHEFHFAAVAGGRVPEGILARNSLFTRYEPVADLFLNRFGRFANRVNNPEKYNALFENEGAPFQAIDGEMDFMLLLEAMCNPKKGQEFCLDPELRKQLFYNGYMGEVNDILAKAAKNTVQVLLGVQTDSQGRHYQTVFRTVLPGWQKKIDNLHTAYLRQKQYITDTDFGPIGDAFAPADFDLRLWEDPNDPNALSPAQKAAAAQQTQPAPAPQPLPGPAPIQPIVHQIPVQPGVPAPAALPTPGALPGVPSITQPLNPNNPHNLPF